MKKIFKSQNLIILLLVIILGHNIYLQIEIAQTKKSASNADKNSYKALLSASLAAVSAASAMDYASDAADNATEAADNAAEAADYAAIAANNAFGSNCWRCPD